MGSNVTEYEIDWLYRSRRIPEGVTCRLPGDEIEPSLNPVNTLFSLLILSVASAFRFTFFREFLDFYELQPHHLPGNAIFYLSCYATFMEAYIIRPTRETFARFFSLRINSVQGKEIPKPKPPVECGSCIVGSRQGSPFFKFTGLESCRAWQGTFFYVKNNGRANLIDLPPFKVGPPSRANWSYNPKTDHPETNRVVRFMATLKKETNICSDDIIRTFISRRVLSRRVHRMSEMYGPGNPTKITGRPLSKKDVVARLGRSGIAMPFDGNGASFPSALLTLRPKNPALKLGSRPAGSEGSARTSSTSSSLKPGTIRCRNTSASPRGHNKFGVRPLHRRTPHGGGSFLPPENQDTGTSNIGAEEKLPGEPSAPPVVEKKTTSAPETSVPESSNLGGAPSASPSPRTTPTPPPDAPRPKPAGAAPTVPPPKLSKLVKGKATASKAPSGGQQPLVLHVSKAAGAASEKATGLLGRITEFRRGGRELGICCPMPSNGTPQM
ncbi:hypothetical protein QYE76_038286 [Lolium multiflorum]|uniref:Transposase (putative) gypsy type domain-containing protein n=1 Tax=Lolium multiflorum TaxID=4521 RepID=A0AAD8T976_LOLMU|nr:hypothetical protein QYE76_038286 [Lolium multiflorum]